MTILLSFLGALALEAGIGAVCIGFSLLLYKVLP